MTTTSQAQVSGPAVVRTAPEVRIRRSDERGHGKHGWLDSRHTFSFAGYYDPAHMGFGPLRVINEDRVVPGAGFGRHPHRDMEIISVVLSGAIEHRDSIGNGTILRAGEVQRMTAGTGVVHSEFNPSPDEPLHFLQIWIEPDRRGYQPGYEQKLLDAGEHRNQLMLVVSPEGSEGSLTIHQDVRLYQSVLDGGEEVVHDNAPGRGMWIQVMAGELDVNGATLRAGDGASIDEPGSVAMIARRDAHLLLFDLGGAGRATAGEAR